MKNVTLIIVFLLSGLSFASDHIDGPITTAHRVKDLTDFYVFPTPNKTGFISIILNSYPIVPKHGHYTNRANYAIIIRRAAIAGTSFSTLDEVIINCSFVTPTHHVDHRINCSTTNGLKASAHYDQVNGPQRGDFLLFGGMRSDPFFFNKDFAESATKGTLIKAKNSNTMAWINSLSMSMEIEIAKLYPGKEVDLLALVAVVVTKDTPTSKLRVLDRIGRPEITNVSMFTPEGELELRDIYNADMPFKISAESREKYEARLTKNISHYDTLDSVSDWGANEKANLVRLLTDDYLVVDLSKPCGADSFFEIEKAMLKGEGHSSCGGRKITDDIMDTLFSLYIGGINGVRIKDGVDAPYKQPSSKFPYLGSPDLDPISLGKAAIARKLLGIRD